MATLLFLILIPILNKSGIHNIRGTLYSVSIGNLDIVDPALMLQNILLTKELYFPTILAAMIPIILALLLGKVFCSWACPFNLLAEFTDKLGRKIRPGSVSTRHRNPKPFYYWLVFGTIIMAVAILGLPLITLISMPGLISAHISDAIRWGVIGIELVLVLLIIVIEMFAAPRFWCKYACPVGATLGLFRLKRTLKIQFKSQACSCNPNHLPCNSACPIQLDPRYAEIYPYCYNCGDCVDACRTEGQALQFTLKPVQLTTVDHKNAKRTID